MVLELMTSGDLRNFLIKKRAREKLGNDRLYTEVESIEGALTSRELLNIGIQVCRGIDHLEQNKAGATYLSGNVLFWYVALYYVCFGSWKVLSQCRSIDHNIRNTGQAYRQLSLCYPVNMKQQENSAGNEITCFFDRHVSSFL